MFLKKCSSIREFDYADLDIGKGCKLVISFSLERILHLLTELFLEHSQQFGNTVTLTNGCVKLPSILCCVLQYLNQKTRFIFCEEKQN